jgi:hypothetical protein
MAMVTIGGADYCPHCEGLLTPTEPVIKMMLLTGHSRFWSIPVVTLSQIKQWVSVDISQFWAGLEKTYV